MEEQLFTVHFGYSRSKRYAQALELAKLCPGYQVSGEGRNVWHRVTFSENEIDLMASLFNLVREFGRPRIHDAPARILDPIRKDLYAVSKVLYEKGYLVIEGSGKQPRRPAEHHPGYAKVRQAVEEGRLQEAVTLYYDALGDRPFDELHGELLYLKRLTSVPLLGRDILAFRSPSTWTDLIKDNIREYCSCIESAVESAVSAGRQSALDILCLRCSNSRRAYPANGTKIPSPSVHPGSSLRQSPSRSNSRDRRTLRPVRMPKRSAI